MGWPADVPASAHLFVASATDLTDTLDIAGEDAHHLARVLRLRPGEPVTVADGLSFQYGAWAERPRSGWAPGSSSSPPPPSHTS